MATRLRIATFNVENLDDKPGAKPTLAERIALMRPQLTRIDADVLCLQEVNGQQLGGTTQLLALDAFLAGTPYATFHRAFSLADNGTDVLPIQNLVTLSRFPIVETQRFKQDPAKAPQYRLVTAIGNPPPPPMVLVGDRPILYTKVQIDATRVLHVLNLHLKSKLPTNIPGQKVDQFTWKSASGWAEGSFVSSIKRVGQALEVRQRVDAIFDGDENALIAICGDFNADYNDVPIEAIRGDVEDTGNPALARRVLVPCELSIPEPARYSLFHQGRGTMLDHIIASRALLASYRHTEIHNEILHDESIAFATDVQYPESDHAPVIAVFEL